MGLHAVNHDFGRGPAESCFSSQAVHTALPYSGWPAGRYGDNLIIRTYTIRPFRSACKRGMLESCWSVASNSCGNGGRHPPQEGDCCLPQSYRVAEFLPIGRADSRAISREKCVRGGEREKGREGEKRCRSGGEKVSVRRRKGVRTRFLIGVKNSAVAWPWEGPKEQRPTKKRVLTPFLLRRPRRASIYGHAWP